MQWIAGWGKRIKFTIDSSKVDEDLTNFPVLVNLDTTYSGVFNELGNNYKKISFMNPTTGEEYYCEVERWDSVNNNAQLWVKIPHVSSNEDTKFYMLYDNTQNDNSQYIGSATEDYGNYKEYGVYTQGTLYDDAVIVDDYIRLTEAVNSSGGHYILNNLDLKTPFTVTYYHYAGGGNGADEIIFKWDNSYYELSIDEYNDRIYLRENSTIVEEVACSNIDNSSWSQVKIEVTNDETYYYIKLWFRDTLYIDTFRPYRKFSSNEVRWYGRTGGVNNEHRIKNMQIIFTKSPVHKVWDDNFVAVYHLSQDPSTGGYCILDSTINGNHGKPYGGMTSSDLVDANVGKGLDFDGSDDYITTFYTFNPQSKAMCVEATYKTDFSSTSFVVSKGCDSSNNEGWAILTSSPGDEVVRCNASNDSSQKASQSISSLTANEYYTTSLVLNRSSNKILGYINGSNSGWTSGGGGPTDDNISSFDISTSTQAMIGNAPNNLYFKGVIREVRVSSIARTESWLKATYYSNFDQLLVKGQEETVIPGTLDYENKIKIVIPNYSDIDTLYNFPVLLNISGAAGKNNADVRDVFYKLEHYLNRKKIAVTDHTGVAQLYCEIERWDQVEQSAQLWVKVPEISNTTETILYLYYDKNKEDNYLMVGDTGSLPATKVWDKNFVAVYHLSQDPNCGNNCILDSTANENHGTPNGNMTSSNLVNANVGKGLEFDGVDDYVDVGQPEEFSLGDLTITAISNLQPTSSDQLGIISNYGGSGSEQHWGLRDNVNHCNLFYDDGSSWDSVVGSIDISSNWVLLTGVRIKGSSAYVYVNDTLDATDSSVTDTVLTPSANTFIGKDAAGSGYYLNGVLKNITVSNIARPYMWIKATYYSNFDNFVIYDITPEDTWLKTYENGALSPWAKRIKLEIDDSNIDEPLEDFPVLINITEDSGINNANLSDLFNELSNDGLKIAITNTNNKQLYVEVERWDHTEKSAQLWTKVPFIMPHEKTVLYLYYDKNKSDNTDYVGYTGSTVASNVWDDNFVAVYHMSQDPSVGGNCILDSSQHHYNGETINSFSSSNLVNGPIGKAIQFDTVDHFIKLPSTDIIPNNLLTVELIFRQDSDYAGGNGGRIIGKSGEGESVDTNTVRFQHTDATTILYFCEYGNGTNGATCDITVPDSSTGFHTVAYTLENKQFGVVLDGTTYYSSDTADDTDSTANCFIGPSNSNIASTRGYSTFLGVVREVRTSNIKRSEVWLKATHYSNFDKLIYYANPQEYIEPPTRTYYLRGTIKEEGKPVQRIALLYDRASGELIEKTTSGSDGRYTLTTTNSGTHFIVILDDDSGKQYNALIQDRLIPTNS